MTAFNAVRFRVKPGRDQQFLDAQQGWVQLGRSAKDQTSSRLATEHIASSRNGTTWRH